MSLDIRLPVFSKSLDLKIFDNILRNSVMADKETPSKIFVIGDIGQESNASPLLSSGYYKSAKKLGFNTDIYIQNHKFSSDYIDVILAKKLIALPKKSIIILNLSNKLGKFNYQLKSFRKFCEKNNHKYLSSSGLKNINPHTMQYLINSLDVNFKEQHRFGEKLKNALNNGEEVNIQTNTGTDINFNIRTRNAINNSGVYDQYGEGGNMPAGEVYIPPIENLTQGRLILDGSIRTWNKTFIPQTPIKIDIDRGKISKIYKSSMSNQLVNTFSWAAKKAKSHPENTKVLSELGIGTNKNAKIIGTTIVDEKKFETAHVAFGSNAWMGGKNKAITHFDQVFKKPIIRIDGKLFQF